MDAALHPHSPSGALGREEFLALLLIVLQNATPSPLCLSSVYCELPPLSLWAQCQMAQFWD